MAVRRACGIPPARTAADRAHGRHSRAWCAPAPAATPRAAARRSRRPGSPDCVARTRRATRWVKSGLSMMTSASGAAVGHGIGGLADQPQDLRQLLHHRGEADDRQLLDRKQRVPALRAPWCGRRRPRTARRRRAAGAAPSSSALPSRSPDSSVAIRKIFRLGSRRLHHAGRPMTKRYLASASAIIACGSAAMVLPAMTAMPARPAAGDALDGARADRRQVEAQILAALRRLHQHAAAGGRADATLLAQAARRARAARRCPRCPRPPPHGRRSPTAAWPMSNGPSAVSTARPRAMSVLLVSLGQARLMQPSGISRSGATSLMPTMRKPSCSRMRPTPDKQMIVAAAKGADDIAEQPQRREVEPDLRERGPHQRADEDQVAAALLAEQPHRAAELADRDPAMAEFLHPRGIAGARAAQTAPA